MDPPAKTDVGVNPEKFEEVKEAPPFRCDHFDSEVVHKIAQILLLGLSTACVDNTTGDLFKGPALVAVDIKKEMVDYLMHRSETYVAESVVQEGGQDVETSDHPTDIITDLVDDFTSSKRNLFSRVSGWLLSERREDKIDDFVQEMEISKFWLIDRREAIAQVLLKNIDFKSEYNCDKRFYTLEELDEHKGQCVFRSINCMNEGCSATFCAAHQEKHDSVCTFKILPCEQGCSEDIMRHEMDRHCITVCPMKLVNCPFYSVGCSDTVPMCKVDIHISESLHSHIQKILHMIHKEASAKDLKNRMEQLEKSTDLSMLSGIRVVRGLTLKVKDLDAKLGPLEHVETPETPSKLTEESPKTPKKASEDSPKTPKKVTEDSPKSPCKDSEGSPKTPRKVGEASPKTLNIDGELIPKNLSQVNVETVDSWKTPGFVNEQSQDTPETQAKDNEEIPETPSTASSSDEESNATLVKVIEETLEVLKSPRFVNEETLEALKSPRFVNEETLEVLKSPRFVNEEISVSPQTQGKNNEESLESSKTASSSDEESPRKVAEDINEFPSKVNEETVDISQIQGKDEDIEESPGSPKSSSSSDEDTAKSPKTMLKNVSEESEDQDEAS